METPFWACTHAPSGQTLPDPVTVWASEKKPPFSHRPVTPVAAATDTADTATSHESKPSRRSR